MGWALLNVLHQMPCEISIEALCVRLGGVRDKPPSPVIHAGMPVLHQDWKALAPSGSGSSPLPAQLLTQHGWVCTSDELAVRILEDLHGVVALPT